MQLEPSIQLLDWLLRQRRPISDLTLPEIQQRNTASLDGVLAWLILGPKYPLPRVVNQTIDGRHGPIPTRLYYPALQSGIPLIVFFTAGAG
ncbi:MAG: hypothetical protein ACFBSG_09655 [Leptolyngbyaceae cyanobacterium]